MSAPVESSVVVRDGDATDKSYRLVMQGDVGELTIGDVKKHIATESRTNPKDMTLFFKTTQLTGDYKKLKAFAITDKTELVLRRTETGPTEVSYYSETIQELLDKLKAVGTGGDRSQLIKRLDKSVKLLEQEIVRPASLKYDTKAVRDKAQQLLVEAKRVVGKGENVAAGNTSGGSSEVVDILASVHCVQHYLTSDTRVGRGWDPEARNALKVLSAAFLRLIRFRETVRTADGQSSHAVQWAHLGLVEYTIGVIRNLASKLGDRVSAVVDSPTEFHPTLTMEDIEEMEAVHTEAKEILKKEESEDDVFRSLLCELQELIVFEAKDTAPLSLSPPRRREAEGTSSSSMNSGEGVLTAPVLQDNPYRERLIEFYKIHNPERLNAVEEILESYKGNEEVMFRVLEHKYSSQNNKAPPVQGETTSVPSTPLAASTQQEVPSPTEAQGGASCIVS